MYDHKIVSPDKDTSFVLSPVPGKPNAKPTERLLTLTTCHPKYSDKERYIVHAKFAYWAIVKDGIPEEMKDAGVTRID
jgi:sortase A